MSDEKYKSISPLAIRVIEECSELIFAICKAERFGWDNYHPDSPNGMNNTLEVLCEIEDVERLCDKLKEKIYRIEPTLNKDKSNE